MKFARFFTMLLSLLTVLSVYQDNALARPADQIVELSHTESDESALPNTGTATSEEPDPDEPEKDPEPDPDPFPVPGPRPVPPYSS